jgi:hypothetical protein
VVTNCIITANAGRGAEGGTLNHCTLKGNWGNGGASGSILNHCTLTGNSAYGGGGASSCTLNHCTLTGNSAQYGGGAWLSTLNHCVLTGNEARDFGGGAVSSTLIHCTLASNRASLAGGGSDNSTLNNCILYYNINGNHRSSVLHSCCTTPLPTDGVDNITNEPAFLDLEGGDLRLQSSSPCINAGNNALVSTATDLDGNPRIVGGIVDIGAYEFQSPTSVLSYAWLQQYGLPTDGSADYAEPDGDGLNNWLEWLYGTDPTNAMSALSLFTPTIDSSGVTLSWMSITNHTYFLERSTNLGASPAFLPLASGISGQPGTTTFTDTNAASLGPSFYRVGIQP